MQDRPDRAIRIEADVLHRLVETRDCPAVHLGVLAIAAVDPHYERLVSARAGVGGGAAEGLRPVSGEPFAVLRIESVTEGVADNLVGHHPCVPRLSQA